MPTIEKAKKFIKSRGWRTYYNDNYWVNSKIIKDKKSQDYTNYGVPFIIAYLYEKHNLDCQLSRHPLAQLGTPTISIVYLLKEQGLMPYSIEKRDDQYCVTKENPDGSQETVDGGCHDTKEEAKDHMQAIIINENSEDD